MRKDGDYRVNMKRAYNDVSRRQNKKKRSFFTLIFDVPEVGLQDKLHLGFVLGKFTRCKYT